MPRKHQNILLIWQNKFHASFCLSLCSNSKMFVMKYFPENNLQFVKTISKLYVQVFIKSASVTHEVWSQSGNQGNSWRRGEVFIGIRHNIQVSVSVIWVRTNKLQGSQVSRIHRETHAFQPVHTLSRHTLYFSRWEGITCPAICTINRRGNTEGSSLPSS